MSIAALLLGLAWGAAFAGGWRLYTVTTGSMGTAMPVGTLAVVHTGGVTDASLHDVVAYRNAVGKVVTHRVIEDHETSLITKGDVNGSADPLPVTARNVVGTVSWHARYLGWVAKGLPFLLIGWIAVGATVRLLAKQHRWKRWTFLGNILVLDAVLIWLNPFLGAQALGYTPGAGQVTLHAVSTGIFPIRIVGEGGTSMSLRLGEVGDAVAKIADDNGYYHFYPHTNWTWPWILGVALVCLSPLLWGILVGFKELPEAPNDPAGQRSGSSGARQAPRHVAAVLVAVTFAASSAMIASPWQASAAFTAAVSNSANTAGIKAGYTCRDAMQMFNTVTASGTLKGRLLLGNTMGVPMWAGGQTTGNANTYTTNALATTGTSDVGCQTDYQARAQSAYTFNGSSYIRYTSGSLSSFAAHPANTSNITSQIWFRTTDTNGGVLTCLHGGLGRCVEAAMYVGTSGQLNYESHGYVITSPRAYNDGKWHFAVAQNSSTTGMKLWVDGTLVASNASVTSAALGIFYIQFGNSNGSQSWTNWPQKHPGFVGDLQMGAWYGLDSKGQQIGQSEVDLLYAAGKL